MVIFVVVFSHSFSYLSLSISLSVHLLPGDLLYLDCLTIEGQYLCITCSTSGFYVNSTVSNAAHAVLNPQIADSNYRSVLLYEVLKRHSREFSDRLGNLLSRRLVAHPLSLSSEYISPISLSTQGLNWLLHPQQLLHHADSTRFERTISQSDSRQSARHWNDEFQELMLTLSQSELALEQIVQFETALHRLITAFNDASANGVRLVVDGHLAASNPHEHPLNHIFFHQSILLTPSIDTRRQWPSISVRGFFFLPGGSVFFSTNFFASRQYFCGL